jgi:hypothetical protein
MRIEVMRGKIEKVSQYLQQVEKHLTDMLNGKLQVGGHTLMQLFDIRM